tara:strand:+ start:2092 stop:2472 length:381 start_codon:yes stop_codon:yes gene_type:complete
MEDRVVITLLTHARNQGIVITPERDGLTARGPRAKLAKIILEYKDDVVKFYKGLEERLRAGQQWLLKADAALWDRYNDRQQQVFMENLVRWDMLDSLLEPRRCPIEGGCNTDSPVICRTCGEGGKK